MAAFNKRGEPAIKSVEGALTRVERGFFVDGNDDRCPAGGLRLHECFGEGNASTKRNKANTPVGFARAKPVSAGIESSQR